MAFTCVPRRCWWAPEATFSVDRFAWIKIALCFLCLFVYISNISFVEKLLFVGRGNTTRQNGTKIMCAMLWEQPICVFLAKPMTVVATNQTSFDIWWTTFCWGWKRTGLLWCRWGPRYLTEISPGWVTTSPARCSAHSHHRLIFMMLYIDWQHWIKYYPYMHLCLTDEATFHL